MIKMPSNFQVGHYVYHFIGNTIYALLAQPNYPLLTVAVTFQWYSFNHLDIS